MESKSLLFGIVGFIAGGLIVALAASTAPPAEHSHTHSATDSHEEMSMNAMTDTLKNKSGDEFDREFITQMIAHHQGALDMAKLSATRANHAEIKQLSASIIATQTKEIEQLRTWQAKWNYDTEKQDQSTSSDHAH